MARDGGGRRNGLGLVNIRLNLSIQLRFPNGFDTHVGRLQANGGLEWPAQWDYLETSWIWEDRVVRLLLLEYLKNN